MKSRHLAPRSMVILHFGCFAVLWSGLATLGMLAGGGAGRFAAESGAGGGPTNGIVLVALACHAVAVVVLAWKAQRRLFAHGPVAVVFCGLPLVPLLANVWLVPAFLYLIAVLHVGLASRHESLGRLQA